MTERRRERSAYGHRLRKFREQQGATIGRGEAGDNNRKRVNASVDCGWGRLIFAQTFDNPTELAEAMRAEGPDRRDIAYYVHEPHVVLATAPQELFLDPSHSYRLDLSTYRTGHRQPRGFFVRRLSSEGDAEAVNRIYATRGMVPVPPSYFWSTRDSRSVTLFVAEDEKSGDVMGTVMGIDHRRAFDDPESGSSLWCLAVDPQARRPGIGEALVRRIAELCQARGSAYLDLSVFYDNSEAIALYEKLGFQRVPIYAVKRKNPINEKLFTGSTDVFADLNPYARIIVEEAFRRGIQVDVTDAEGGFFRLTWGGRSIRCRESLSELTSGVAVSICDDKAVARRVAARAGLTVPAQLEVGGNSDVSGFLARYGSVVVKPARGEQGRGVAVGLSTVEEVAGAVEAAGRLCDRVLIEEEVGGSDLRLIVIDHRLVAAALRRPAHVVGDGLSTVRALIERQSRRRSAATGGESRIPLDAETERCVARAGCGLDSVPPDRMEIAVRRTANLHTGGTIHDVTGEVHPRLVEAAVAAARAIGIPVVGIDFIVKDWRGPDFAFIEANERPGLANHEPRPTAERFVDLLFPLSVPQAVRLAEAAR